MFFRYYAMPPPSLFFFVDDDAMPICFYLFLSLLRLRMNENGNTRFVVWKILLIFFCILF